MAQVRRRAGQRELREATADFWAGFVERYPRTAARFRPLVDALDAGEPVDVVGWQVAPAWRPAWLDSWERVRIEPDGSLSRLSP